MELRVTQQVSIGRSMEVARQHSARLADLQEQVSTGKKLLKPSDNPLGSMALLGNNSQIARMDSQLAGISSARTNLNLSVSTLQDAAGVLSSAREIAIEGAQSGNGATAMEALAQEVDALINRLLDDSNAQNGGRYIFGGTATNVPPFRVQSSSNGQPTKIVYQGGAEPTQEVIGQSQTVSTLYPGNQIFQSRQRGVTTFTTNTGAAPGSGTDNATGQGTLTVTHTLTTYAPGSGITAGTSSAGGDTIIGPAGSHRITISDTSGTGAGGTVSLDGGPPVAFTNLDTNLKVSSPIGDVVYVNTTAITPAFNGNVNITADGTLSVDGGATQTPIDFSTNQVLTNSATAAITNVNSSGIRRTGSDNLDYSGTYDAFEILIALRDDLRNSRGMSSSAQAEAISGRVAELERVHQGVLDTVGQQSVSLQNLDALEKRIGDVKLEVQSQNADLESVDMSSAILELQNEENALKLTFAAAARVFDQSLLDFLK